MCSHLKDSTAEYSCLEIRIVSYIWSLLSIFAPESHLDGVLVPRPLVKGLTRLERGAVQMQADCALCVADIFHAVQANGVLDSRSQKKEREEGGKREREREHSATGML